VTLEVIHRPAATEDYRAKSKYRFAGIAVAALGFTAAMTQLVANAIAGHRLLDPHQVDTVRGILAWSPTLAFAGFSVIKVGIAIVLVGIIARLWMRVDSVKYALTRLKPKVAAGTPAVLGAIKTEYGPATATTATPSPYFVHRMAKAMWAPLVAMGVMASAAGLALSFVQSGNVFSDPFLARQQGAWATGLLFLGEGLLLSGISFLLGTILGSLREGGGEVQESVGVVVKTLKMPWTSKVFLGLMATGLMVSMAQFGLYVASAYVRGTASFNAWSAWLVPVREAGLGLLLSGIVFALVTIGNVLGFQFSRIREILRTGA
jgi:hypothetical protein